MNTDEPRESFRGLVLRHRGRTGLTQRQLAERLGVHLRSLQAWEAGASQPDAGRLQALISSFLEVGGFSVGQEPNEARALWDAGLRASTRLRSSFDGAWFADLLANRGADSDRTGRLDPTAPATLAPAGLTGGA